LKLDLPQGSHCTVVNAGGVEIQSQKGFKVVAVVPSTRLDDPSAHLRGYSSGSSDRLPSPQLVHEPLFLMIQDADARVATLQSQLEDRDRRVSETWKKCVAAEKDAKAHLETYLASEKAFATLRAQHDHLELGYAGERKMVRKLEGDIGKLRREIGEARFREILATGDEG